ncbi:hypothetical protein NDU88_007538 [Pleurodeles waltl]|uniref:Secreted protein n=1 Tax=Pleurodeles waltl TaxID=8319 RepID=A0AAV7ST19_PLEWA|nr:hypothetical protein NDU88_007538 [Pleurodeles waltl]
MFRFVMLFSPLVAKVSEPLVSFDGWCEGPHLHETLVSSQPRAAAAAISLFCRGCHFGLEFSGRSLLQGEAAVPTCAVYSLITSLQSRRPPVVTMAGFKLRA